MNEKIFRKNSIAKVSSPEQLNEYLRVSSPGVWMVLAAIVILLIGVCAWGFLGHLDTKINTVAVAENSGIILYVKESDIDSVKTDMTVFIGENEYKITDISSEPVSANEGFSEYALHVGNLKAGEWVYPVSTDGEIAEGVYNAEIIVESISPISFVIN